LQASESAKGLFEVLSGEPVEDIIQRKNKVCVLRGQISLTGANTIFTDIGMEYLLHDVIEPLQAIFDYIIIDNPPRLGILNVNAHRLAYSDIVFNLFLDELHIRTFLVILEKTSVRLSQVEYGHA